MFAFDNGALVSLVPGDHTVKHRDPNRIEFVVANATVVVGQTASFPQKAEYFVENHGAKVLAHEADVEHVAFALRVRKNAHREETNEVLAFTRGLVCQGEQVPDEDVDAVFEFCASLRRGGGILGYSRLPKVTTPQVFGLPAVEIVSDQFVGSRIEWSEELTCDRLRTEAADYKRNVSNVEVLKMEHGDVRTYWSVDPDVSTVGHSKIWALRGEYCCSLEIAAWFEPAPPEDVRALASLCDRAAETGWPQSALPEPISLEQ